MNYAFPWKVSSKMQHNFRLDFARETTRKDTSFAYAPGFIYEIDDYTNAAFALGFTGTGNRGWEETDLTLDTWNASLF